ncbi:hypothetical protein HOY34_21145 [Xinfangfangia sp. D13-10-4-6]|uniref:hypothetical protein n=1 Tax=Pseudogemmobacter hezensis TaxID=2737662 RepID=UPI001555E73B|nr:hypothetical protein [Pseudogemmobacter hezensis]NPD17688.1 hypothetical protein [Pseudogemmobacter hezensis]
MRIAQPFAVLFAISAAACAAMAQAQTAEPDFSQIEAESLDAEDMEVMPGQQTDGWISLEAEGARHDFITVSFLYDTMRVGTASVTDGSETGNEDILAISGGTEPDGSGPFFHLAFGWPGEGAEPRLKPEITWYPEGQEPPFYASLLARPPEVRITSYSFDGKSGSVSGSFSGAVCRVISWETEEPDAADCRDVSGEFETKLHPAF